MIPRKDLKHQNGSIRPALKTKRSKLEELMPHIWFIQMKNQRMCPATMSLFELSLLSSKKKILLGLMSKIRCACKVKHASKASLLT